MIAWLIKQVGNLAARISQLARDALSWARSEAASAYGRALAWARTAIDAAKAFLRRLIDAARDLAVALYQAARSYALTLYHLARAVADLAIGALRSLLLGLIAGAKALALQLFSLAKALWNLAIAAAVAGIRAWAAGAIEFILGVRQKLLAVIAWWDDFGDASRQLLRSLIELLATGGMSRLLTLLQTFWTVLAAFLADPIGVLAAWFSDFLIPWIFQEIAFGLGTVKYDLPPRKVWGKNSGTVPLPGGTGPPPGAGQISPPVSPLRISGYHYSADHPGVDLGIQRGQAIYAAHDGEVIYTAEGFTDYGHQIVLAGGDWWTRYAHLARLGVSRGDRVRAQSVIAAGNSTGNSSGDHLHFEVKFRGQYVDPLGVLAGI